MPHDLKVVLVEPKIHVNTGTIGRLCLATGSTLHLVEPLGFQIDSAKVKRAGLDYWKFVDVVVHKSWDDFLSVLPEDAPRIFLSTKAKSVVFDHQFKKGTYLIFGSETEGLPKDLLEANPQISYCLPQYDERVRSLNLANAASVVVYEAIRQLGV
jgi:tRNA (cytidine/uridine-2'-O-)-methyltransferase